MDGNGIINDKRFYMLTIRLLILVLAIPLSTRVMAVAADFESLPDGTPLIDQYSELAFSNAVVLTSGLSLNEFEFPPRSGVNSAADENGPIEITFSSPVTTFSAYFTYTVPLELAAFDSGMALKATVSSLFNNNQALSGEAGSSPNEFIELAVTGGFTFLRITGSPSGGSFVFDDLSASAVPIVGAWSMFAPGLLAIGGALRRSRAVVVTG
jgi:hypothetical protein